MFRDSRSQVLGIAVLIAIIAWAGVFFSGSRQLEVTFLDVGDGLCTIVRSPSGRTMVMDCGTSSWRDNPSVGRKLAVPYLQSMGLDSIDVVVLSHPHEDHMCGLAGLLQAVPAKLVLDVDARQGSPEHKQFIMAVKSCKARYRIARRGQVIDLGDGVTASILNPAPDAAPEDLNDESVVMRIVYKRAAILLDADASEPAERSILDSDANVRAQVLQVGHHGSKDASSAAWLAAVHPQIAVISCARRSHYGFPARQTIDRLASLGARTYVTGRNGAVTVTTDGSSIRVKTYGHSQ